VHTPRAQSGAVVARILAGAWRASPPPVDFSEEELVRVLPLLLRSGAGPLAWWKIRHSPLAETEAGSELRQAFRHHTLRAATREPAIATALEALRGHGVRPLLMKGWAAARLYPSRGLRPYGDIDLYVSPAVLPAALDALAQRPEPYCAVEVHAWPEEWLGSRLAAEARAEQAEVAGAEVLIPCREDHLRLLALHLVKHGAWRPLWLCDLAAALEGDGESLDWSRVLGSAHPEADWIAATLQLAHVLLGARLPGALPAAARKHLPRWLARAVLRHWSTGSGPSRRATASSTLAERGASAGAWAGMMRSHWRDPVRASYELGVPFNKVPRAPLQLAATARRLGRVVRTGIARRHPPSPGEVHEPVTRPSLPDTHS
jgi:hypothetical protein